MASRIRKLFIDVVNRKLYTAFTGKILASLDNFYISDEELIEVHALKPNPDLTSNFPFIYVTPTGVVELGLGLPDQLSTGGNLALTDPIASQNTPAFAFNSTASAAQTAIQTALSTTYPACQVTKNSDGDFTIDRVTVGVVSSPLVGIGGGLTPESFVGVYVIREGTADFSQITRVICLQKPVAYSSLTVADNPLPAAAVTCVQTQVGGTGVNSVYQVSINVDAYQGSFSVTSTKLGVSNTTTGTSAAIPFDAAAADILAAVNAGFGAGNEVTATLVNDYTWSLEFTGTNVAGKDLGTSSLSGSATALTVPVGVSGILDLRTSTGLTLLGTSLNIPLYLEVRNDDGTYLQTWLQQAAKLNNTILDPEALGATEFPDYLTQAQGDIRYLRSNQPWLVKTGAYTATAADKVQADTTGAAFAVTLPASPSVGDGIQIEDAGLTWDTHNLTVARNGNKINGGTTDYTANVIGGKLSCVYVSSAVGWSIK